MLRFFVVLVLVLLATGCTSADVKQKRAELVKATVEQLGGQKEASKPADGVADIPGWDKRWQSISEKIQLLGKEE